MMRFLLNTKTIKSLIRVLLQNFEAVVTLYSLLFYPLHIPLQYNILLSLCLL